MKDMKKVLLLRTFGTYYDVRKVADKMVLSLISENEEGSTYASTVVLTWRGKLGKFLLEKKYGVLVWDKQRLHYKVKIYKMLGNRESKISISNNEKLKKIALEELKNIKEEDK